MHKFGAATASAAAAMTAAASETNYSTRTRTGDDILQQQQSFSQQGGTVSDSNVQRLLSQMMQTAEAANQIQRQRDALAHAPPQQQQVQDAVMPPTASLGRLLSHSGSNQLQQQLQELASLLSLPSHISSQTGNSQFSSLAGSAAAAAQAQQEPQQQQPDGTPEPPIRELRTLASLADSSTQEATAADALLDLEFAARDAGSFTRNRAHLAAALGRALAEGSITAPSVQAPGKHEEQGATAGTVKLEPMASPPPAAGAAVAAGRHRSGSGTGPCFSTPGTAAQPGAACAPSTASAPAAAAAAEGASACGRLQQELLALLTQQVASLAQRGPSTANELSTIPQDSAQAAAQAPAAAATAPPVLSAVPRFPCCGPQQQPSRAAALPEDVPILPILQTLKKQMALRQQAAAGAAAGSCVPAPPAAAGFGAAAAAAAGGGLARNDSSTFLERLLQQNRQLQAISATKSGGLEHQQGEGRPAVRRNISNLTNSTVVTGLESHPATASGGAEACRMQQKPAQALVLAGPYSSYLDAELLNLYSEFKTARKQVLAIVQEAVDQGVMNCNVVRRLQQLQHMRQRATDSPTFTLGTAAAQSAGAAPSGSAGGTLSALVSLGKRARDQQRGAGCAADAAAVDADAPSSKLRRTELSKGSGTAAAGAADTVSGKTAGHAAAEAKAQGEDMDVSAPNDSSAPTDAAAGADDGTGATAAAAPSGEAAAAADSDAQAAATPKAANPAAPAAALREPASPSADSGLLPRSVETLVLVHSLTNRALAKAVSTKKESCDALTRAEEFSAMTASSHSSIQHLQLQNQMLQQQLQLAHLQLQAKQQQLVQVQARSQHVNVAYPQLVARVAKSVNRLVSTAHHDHLPVAERQELAAIAEDLLTACNLQ